MSLFFCFVFFFFGQKLDLSCYKNVLIRKGRGLGRRSITERLQYHCNVKTQKDWINKYIDFFQWVSIQLWNLIGVNQTKFFFLIQMILSCGFLLSCHHQSQTLSRLIFCWHVSYFSPKKHVVVDRSFFRVHEMF